MEYHDALKIAQSVADSWNQRFAGKDPGGPIGIFEEKAFRSALGWVFWQQSKEFIRTKELRLARLGTLPLLVLEDGQVACLPIEESVEKTIDELRTKGKIQASGKTLEDLVLRTKENILQMNNRKNT